MRPLSTLRPALLTAALLSTALLGLVLAGCSSGSSNDSSNGSEATARPGSTSAASAPLARYAAYQSVNYDDPAHWLCFPGAQDVCSESDLDATVVQADGSTEVQPFTADPDAPIDCFYVYPTVSKDSTRFSDWDVAPDQEDFATLNQAARLASKCRLYVPIYRQVTTPGMLAMFGSGSDMSLEDAYRSTPYEDVSDAFRTYMAKYNDGRGVVLIGHSQGGWMVRQLLTDEVDPNPEVRAELVSAYIAGWPTAVPPGADVGGAFQNVPVCQDRDQVGCVLAWSSFSSTSPPPPNAFFGKIRDGSGMDAICASPAAVAGQGDALQPYFPSGGGATTPSLWLDAPAGTITTPYVTLPGLVTGACVSNDGFDYLSVTVHPDPSGPRTDEIAGGQSPQWGLHTIDVSLEMGNIVDLVAQQSAAYTASHPG